MDKGMGAPAGRRDASPHLVRWPVAGARRRDNRLAVPVTLYITVISVMVASAIGTGVAIAVVGAVLFYVSDIAGHYSP